MTPQINVQISRSLCFGFLLMESFQTLTELLNSVVLFCFTEEYFAHGIAILLNPLFMNKDLSHPGIKTSKRVLAINTILSLLPFLDSQRHSFF